jgi:hypothetical protein
MAQNELLACQPNETKVQKKEKAPFLNIASFNRKEKSEFGLCYHLINAISFSLSQSDHNKQFGL